MKKDNLIDITNLKVHFPIHGGLFFKKIGDVKAVDGVSFTLKEGETLGLVGESGCGKTTVGKALINLVKSTSGEIKFPNNKGEKINIANLSRSDMRPFRSDIQMIFQDP